MKLSLRKESDGPFGYIDQNETSHPGPNEWLWVELMGGCSCGSPDLPDRARRVFDLFATPHKDRTWSVFSDTDRSDEILAHWMDHAGLLEHGGNISGSWLSTKGFEVLEALQSCAVS